MIESYVKSHLFERNTLWHLECTVTNIFSKQKNKVIIIIISLNAVIRSDCQYLGNKRFGSQDYFFLKYYCYNNIVTII